MCQETFSSPIQKYLFAQNKCFGNPRPVCQPIDIDPATKIQFHLNEKSRQTSGSEKDRSIRRSDAASARSVTSQWKVVRRVLIAGTLHCIWLYSYCDMLEQKKVLSSRLYQSLQSLAENQSKRRSIKTLYATCLLFVLTESLNQRLVKVVVVEMCLFKNVHFSISFAI